MGRIEPIKLTRKDGKVVDVTYYNNADIDNVDILEKNLRLKA